MNPIKAYQGLPKPMYTLFLAVIVNRFGDFVFPFLSLLLTRNLGYSQAVSGTVLTLTTLVGIPGAWVGGRLADRWSRKYTLITLQALAALCLIPCAFEGPRLLTVVCLILSQFFGSGARPSQNAMVADIVPEADRARGYALTYLGINLGVAIGPLVAGYLFAHALPLLFLGDAATTLIASVFLFRGLPDIRACQIRTPGNTASASQGSVFSILARNPLLLVFYLVNILFSLVYTQHRFSLPLTTDSVFGVSGAVVYGHVMAVNALTVIVLTVPLTSLTRKLTALQCMALASVAYILGFGMLGFVHHYALFLVSSFVWTIGEILVVTHSSVFITQHCPASARGRMNAVSSWGWVAGASLGTAGMGAVIGSAGLSWVWGLTALVSLAGGAGMLLIDRYDRRHPPEAV